jgi:hypothetical protein
MMPPATTPHIPGTSASRSDDITWQVDVPMIATIWPGRVASAAAAVTWASTLPAATAIPSGRPVQAAARGLSRPAGAPRASSGPASLSVKSAKAGSRALR